MLSYINIYILLSTCNSANTRDYVELEKISLCLPLLLNTKHMKMP